MGERNAKVPTSFALSAWGSPRSEVKEEVRVQPEPGDMSVVGYPML